MVDFAVESLVKAQPDIEKLLPEQWAHTGDTEIEAKPNWNFYRHLDAHNAGILVMAREDCRPVGYLVALIYPHPNSTEHLVANIPTYFVENRHSRPFIMARMVDFALERLAERGVFKIDIETNAEHSAGRLWELKGFKISKIGYSLKLKAKPEVKYA